MWYGTHMRPLPEVVRTEKVTPLYAERWRVRDGRWRRRLGHWTLWVGSPQGGQRTWLVLLDGQVHGLGHAGGLVAAMARAEHVQAALARLTQIPARPVDAPGFSRGTGARLPHVFACRERAILWT